MHHHLVGDGGVVGQLELPDIGRVGQEGRVLFVPDSLVGFPEPLPELLHAVGKALGSNCRQRLAQRHVQFQEPALPVFRQGRKF